MARIRLPTELILFFPDGAQVLLEAAEQGLGAAAALQGAAVGHGQEDQVDGPHGVVHAAPGEQAGGQLIAGLEFKAVMQDAEDLGQALHALENDGEQHAGAHGQGDAYQAGQTHDARADNHQDGQQQDGAHIEALLQSGLELGGHSGVIVAAAGDKADDGVQDDSNHKGGGGGGHHGGHMVEQAGFRHGGGQVGSVGQGGELVAHIGAGDDHTGGDGWIDAQAGADAQHGNTHSSGGGPGGAAGQAHDGAQDAADGQEQLGGEEVQTVVNQSGDGARHDEGGDQQAHGAQNQDIPDP